MLQFYRLFRKKLSPAPAMYLFLLTNITFWFLTGTLAGAVFALCFPNTATVLSCAVTSGAFFALAVGYVYGYIAVIRTL